MTGHRVVAAIDFGTHGSGFAWAVVNEINRDMTQREIFYFDAWDAQQVVYPKNLSALLLDKRGNLLDWGYQAQERMYLEGLPDGRRYETNYKMSLQQNIGMAGTLASSDGTGTSKNEVSRLIATCIREVYQKALEHIQAGGVYTESDIAWCITVPAIWDEYTKDLMLTAARRAGLPDGDRLMLALEPEAAALYCIVKGDRALTVPGCRFMVIDAGGGTIDITSYRVESGPRLSQLGIASGDKAGSEYLDRFFEQDVLCDRFGAAFVAALKHRYPREFYELMGAWARAKRLVTTTDTRPVSMPLPAQVYNYAREDGAALDGIRHRQDGIDTAIIISADEVREVFEKAVGAIIGAVAEQLRRMWAAAGKRGGESALLVGGFGESPYLQARLREYLKAQGVALHIPPRPSVAVMTGATHFAYDPSVIRDRRSPLTFGLNGMSRFRKGIDPDSKLNTDDDGIEWCGDRFHVLVKRDEAVGADECRTLTFGGPLRSAYESMLVQVVATSKSDPVYTTDPGVDQKANIVIPYGSAMSLPREQRQVQARLYFGDTRIRVEAENLHNGQTEQAEITWMPTW